MDDREDKYKKHTKKDLIGMLIDAEDDYNYLESQTKDINYLRTQVHNQNNLINWLEQCGGSERVTPYARNRFGV